ncbi:hypothetical protein [Motilimonas sp. E26]|uniref:hypothetical protein n=1 Tax=Motilimonas sp. E26 TaxID=2865674 RepID=UPI001E4B7CF4|nr:hypothetical protein [Motilimonas sp. E26]MCE0556715.1 hypothetical protein [Motilimonas sp. E26]
MPILIPLVFELLARPFAGDTTGNGETFTDTLLDCLADAYKGLFLVTPNSFWGKSVLGAWQYTAWHLCCSGYDYLAIEVN